SNASHKTKRKIATPAMKAPGFGIMCGIVLVWVGRREAARCSGVEARADGDLGLEKSGYRATGLGAFDRGVKLGLVGARNGGDEIEVALGDGETVADFLERDGGRGFEFLRGHSCAAELCGKRHGETPRVG